MGELSNAPAALVGAVVPIVVDAPGAARPTRNTGATGATGATGVGLLRTARPRQWIKNVLVFAAPGAAGVLTQGPVLGRATLAFAVFCLASSGAYFVNDASDVELDRQHPSKRFRPVAAGTVPVPLAYGLGAALFAMSIVVGLAFLGWHFATAVVAYVAINVAYNAGLRFEPVLDLAAVASGFVVRAVAGGFATDVRLSEWFLVVLCAASLFVVAGKRQAASVTSMDTGRPGRIDYPGAYLKYVRLLASGVALTAYGLWAFDKSAGIGSVLFELTIVPFSLAILRYALLVEKGEGEAPEDLLLGDGPILGLMAVWAVLFALGVYGA